ncbi:MAG: hypothetical protein QOJ64_2011 [Acidobacteriota bacterium]|nr:hypothetical protein [Acidobacteriota bacterium]
MLTQLARAIILSTLICFPVWIAARVVINISRRRLGEATSMKRELLLGSFFLYALVVMSVTIVPLRMSMSRVPGSSDINVVPVIKSLKCMFAHRAGRQDPMVRLCVQNIVGNILLFLPLGGLLPLVSKNFRSLKKVMLVALISSVGIEVAQLLFGLLGSVRSSDIDDVLLNTMGAFLGFIVYTMVKKVYVVRAAC